MSARVKRNFVVTDVATQNQTDVTLVDGKNLNYEANLVQMENLPGRMSLDFLRNADPTCISSRRSLLQCVWQLQGCVKLLEEQRTRARTPAQ